MLLSWMRLVPHAGPCKAAKASPGRRMPVAASRPRACCNPGLGSLRAAPRRAAAAVAAAWAAAAPSHGEQVPAGRLSSGRCCDGLSGRRARSRAVGCTGTWTSCSTLSELRLAACTASTSAAAKDQGCVCSRCTRTALCGNGSITARSQMRADEGTHTHLISRALGLGGCSLIP